MMKTRKACCMFFVEIELSDGSVHHFNCRSKSDVEKQLKKFDYSCISDYCVREVSYYELITEVM